MAQQKMDIAKVLAILAQPQKKPEPLQHVERFCLDIPYITRDGATDVRPVRVVMPEGAARPMPLIYVPHYEMGEDSLELRDYLAQGWAVACPDKFNDTYNAALTDNDLVFNNAALYTLRRRPEFDKNRIALVGGSAGGYMTLMLNGLQMGLCASIANGPVPNVYFNFQHYWRKADALNQQALRQSADDVAKAPGAPEDPLQRLQHFAKAPIPFLAGLMKIFSPILDNFPDKNDCRRWEEHSPIGLTDCFCSPIMINHNTSDVLVPVDQITRKFTYPTPGDSLPQDFDMRLPQDLPGRLRLALDEALPAEELRLERFVVPEADKDIDLPYDKNKRFNLNIFDDGPAEGYGTHSSRMDTGRKRDVPYLREMFQRTAASTCVLTPAMLKRLLRRFQGKSIPLPAHEDANSDVYGSLAVYRQEVQQELTDWMQLHGQDALKEVYQTMMVSEPDASLCATMAQAVPLSQTWNAD